MRNRISIIVPIYGDWNSLKKCIESLKKYIPTDVEIILVNDKGPEWKAIETEIKQLIEDDLRFTYFLNENNLGFVSTCNKAVGYTNKENDILLLNSDTIVTEGFLKEMYEVLYACERHGVVCPRSNNASLLSIPSKINTNINLTTNMCYEVFKQIKQYLPQWTVIPTAVGFCMLIKRHLINEFDLFDEVYSPGYNEENDFCMRINQYGYNVVMANHTFVYHMESKSFLDRRAELESEHAGILINRYPHYQNSVKAYFSKRIEPVDYFSDLIANGIYKKNRVLFSLYEIPGIYNGTSKKSIKNLEYFYKLFCKKYDIYVLINPTADEFFGISKKYKNVYYPTNISGTFHLAYSPTQIFSVEHLVILNRTCLKIMFDMQDIISIRSQYIIDDYPEREEIFRYSITYANKITFISNFSRKDTKAYYNSEFIKRDIPTAVIYHGVDRTINSNEKYSMNLPFEDYFVVFGNGYKHKFIEPFVEVAKKSNYNYVVLSGQNRISATENIYCITSGLLDERFINMLVKNSMGIIFPSLYEGFGLPFLDGMSYRKKLIAYNSELNRELREYFKDYANDVYLYQELSEIEEILNEIKKNPVIKMKDDVILRDWEGVIIELEREIASTMNEDVDTKLLCDRWNTINYIMQIHKNLTEKNYYLKKIMSNVKRYTKCKFPWLYSKYKTHVKRKI